MSSSRTSDTARRATIRDVAREACVSIKTVSRALNGLPYVSDDVRQRVQAAAEAIGYAPDERGRRLARLRGGGTERLERVGFLLFPTYSKYSEPFFAELMEELDRAVLQWGWVSAFCHTLSEVDENPTLKRRLAARTEADGVVIVGMGENRRADVARVAAMAGHAVIVSSYLEDRTLSAAHFDRTQGARRVMQHLLSLGHTRIACITGFADAVSYNRLALDGYTAALTEAGVPFRLELVREGRYSVAGAFAATDALLNDTKPRPTAIFCASDPMALGVYNAIHKNGLRIPDDISVAACDDIRLGRELFPALTTAGGDKVELAKAALRLLREEVDGERTAPVTVTLPMQLVERESCAPPKRRRT